MELSRFLSLKNSRSFEHKSVQLDSGSKICMINIKYGLQLKHFVQNNLNVKLRIEILMYIKEEIWILMND